MEDCQGKTIYCCRYCELKTRVLDKIINHIPNCKDRYSSLEEGKDFVICKICNCHRKVLTNHIRIEHNISIKDYQEKYGPLLCDNSSETYSLANVNKVSWQEKAKEDNIDLTELYKRNGKIISESILNNTDERIRRSELMKEMRKTLYDDSEVLKKISDAAKETAARPEIIEQRAANLKKWRDNNPEDFKTKCTDKMLQAKPDKINWFSKPEKMLYQLLLKLSDFNFKFNQVIKSSIFDWKSKRKQIDMADKNKGIYVEFDGPWHFIPMGNEEKFKEAVRRDRLLEQHIKDNNLILIRISYDQFHDSRKNPYFYDECIEKLFTIINSNNPGIFKIGNKYE